MIELKNISAKTIIPLNDYSIKELINKIGAKSVEDVLNIIKKYPEYNWNNVLNLYSEVEREMNLANKRGYEPEIFYTKGYTDEQLLIQDTINYGDILMFENPTHFTTSHLSLKNKTINQIKDDLSHTISNGKNYISSSNSLYRKIGVEKVANITTQIEMFEEQIERQALLTDRRDINLFELDKKIKQRIVEELYQEIIIYLVCNTEERLVWNSLTDAKKKVYLSSTINKKQEDIRTKQIITDYIANYTTLPELEILANHNLNVLKRFIIK